MLMNERYPRKYFATYLHLLILTINYNFVAFVLANFNLDIFIFAQFSSYKYDKKDLLVSRCVKMKAFCVVVPVSII